MAPKVDESELELLSVELRRVADRLDTMPLRRAESCADAVHMLAGFLVERTRAIGGGVPADATLPRLGTQGLGAMVAVLGRDYLTAAQTSDASSDDVRAVLDRVTQAP